MGASYAGQAEEKIGRLARALSGVGLRDAELSWVPAPSMLRYRNRVRLRSSAGELAFFNPEKLPGCAVLEPDVVLAIEELSTLARVGGLSGVSHLEVRARDSLSRRGLALSPAPGRGLRVEAISERLGEGWLVIDRSRPGSSELGQRFVVAADTYVEVPVDAFLQVNSEVNRLLVDHVRRGALARGAREFVDLFMGAGNFALPLARAGLVGGGVERHAGAVAAARRAARAQGIALGELCAGDSFERAEGFARAGRRFELVVCDAPRAGLADRADLVAALSGRLIALCSCHAEHFARDVARFAWAGFRLESVTAFDMFPQTAHLEAVGWLSRAS